MRRNERGYTVAELVVVLAVFAIVITLTAVTFNRIVSSSSHLMKSGKTQIEGMIGLELLRIDLENAGFGLPWSYQSSGFLPAEAPSGSAAAAYNEQVETDKPDFQAPRGVVVGSGTGVNGSDYLVVKGTAVGMNRTARKWSYLTYSSQGAVVKGHRADADGELVLGSGQDRVIVLKDTVKGGVVGKELVMDGSTFSFTFTSLDPKFLPHKAQDRYVVYGVDSDTDLSSPFNRADYYLSAYDDRPARCLRGTARLSKWVLNQGSSTFSSYPLLDCVADFQVVVGMDSDQDGQVDTRIDDLTPYDAQTIREEVTEIGVYILAQDGGRDRSYLYQYNDPARAITVGDRVWRAADLAAKFGGEWQQYRWKIFSIVVQPKNLH